MPCMQQDIPEAAPQEYSTVACGHLMGLNTQYSALESRMGTAEMGASVCLPQLSALPARHRLPREEVEMLCLHLPCPHPSGCGLQQVPPTPAPSRDMPRFGVLQTYTSSRCW